MKNGAGHIEAQNIMATITGQGLGVQERWDGKITVAFDKTAIDKNLTLLLYPDDSDDSCPIILRIV